MALEGDMTEAVVIMAADVTARFTSLNWQEVMNRCSAMWSAAHPESDSRDDAAPGRALSSSLSSGEVTPIPASSSATRSLL